MLAIDFFLALPDTCQNFLFDRYQAEQKVKVKEILFMWDTAKKQMWMV